MHHQVRVGQALVDLDQAVHLQHLARGLLVELVGAVAGADGDGQRVDAGGLRRTRRPGRGRSGAEAVEAGAVAVFDAAQAADFAFHGDALGVRHVDHFARGLDVVLEASRASCRPA